MGSSMSGGFGRGSGSRIGAGNRALPGNQS